jgi:SNF2 family DNA or RNA helicase
VVESTAAGFVDLTARHNAAPATIGQHRSSSAVNDVYSVGLGGGPDDFVAAEKATESIKALLQGAVDDDDDEEEGGKKKRKNKRRETAKKKGGKAAKDVKELVAGVQDIKVDKEAGDAAVQVQSKDAEHETVKREAEDGEDEEGEEEDDDEDEGVVDGLRVRLLPHQVDGLEWMTDKEIGKRRGKGVLPKGGILADDVSLIINLLLHARF